MKFRNDNYVPTSTYTYHSLTSVDNIDVEDGNALPGDGQIPLRQDGNDDYNGEQFQRGDTLNDDGERALPSPDVPFIITILLTVTVFMSLPWIFGVYGPKVFTLLPNASIFIESINPSIMKYVKAERKYGGAGHLMLFNFDKTPKLDIVSTWSDNNKLTLSGDGEKVEWMYFLNTGSVIDISYNVTSTIPHHVYLGIKEGPSSSANMFMDLFNTTVLWGSIEGTGEVRHDIKESGTYYIVVRNSRIDIVEVELQIKIRSLVYNTSSANYRCNISVGSCCLKIPSSGENHVLLEYSEPKPGNGDAVAHVQVSYEPRWVTYLSFSGGLIGLVTIITAVEFLFSIKFSPTIQGQSIPLEVITSRTSSPENIEPKDDNVASSHDTDDPEEDGQSAGSHNGNAASDHHEDVNRRSLCAICFNAAKDCLFVPCGHCVSCYACGRKVAEATGICPICRRHMKVKRIYNA